MQHHVKRRATPQEAIERKKRHDAPLIKEYQDLAALCFENRRNKKQDYDALAVTTDLLDRNPENYTFWNIRREIFLEGIFPALIQGQEKDDGNDTSAAAVAAKQKILLGEIQYVLAKLKQFPKTYWLWNHRSWCINNFPGADWNQELGLVDYLLSKDPRNFHGWHYRRVVVDQLTKLHQFKPKAEDEEAPKTMVQHEFKFTTSKINQDFSNFSAWYNRALLIPEYLAEKVQESSDESFRTSFLESEINYVRQALFTDPEMSSAWFYHKWLYQNLSRSVVPSISPESYAKYLQDEIDIVEELAAEEPENSYCLLALVYLRDLLRAEQVRNAQDEQDHERVIQVYDQLQQIDPLRKRMYGDWKEAYLKSHGSD